MHQLLESQVDTMTQIRDDMSRLRATYPGKESIPGSLLGDKRSIEAVFSDAESVLDDTEFEFDDLVVNSRAYRHAMKVAISLVSSHPERAEDLLTEKTQYETDEILRLQKADHEDGEAQMMLGNIESQETLGQGNLVAGSQPRNTVSPI